MKILIKVHRSPEQLFLVDLNGKNLIRDVARMIARGRRSQAIVTALSKGKFERQIKHNEIPAEKVDVVLSEERASWDLTNAK
ncbi:hypothetical protein ACFL42_00445 [Candidatus Omnitrophota bacterium]